MNLDAIAKGPLRVLRDVLRAVENDHMHFGPSVREVRRAIDQALEASSAATRASDDQDAETRPPSAVPEAPGESPAKEDSGLRCGYCFQTITEDQARHALITENALIDSVSTAAREAGRRERDAEVAELRTELARVTAEGDKFRDDVEFFERGHFRAGSLAKAEANLARVTAERDEALGKARRCGCCGSPMPCGGCAEDCDCGETDEVVELRKIAEILADYGSETPAEGVRTLMQDLHDTCRERDTALKERDSAMTTKCGAHPGGRTTCGQCFTNLEAELLTARSALAAAQAEAREFKNEWVSAVERAKSAEYLLQQAQAEAKDLRKALFDAPSWGTFTDAVAERDRLRAEVERHRLNTESEAREVESLYRERTALRAERDAAHAAGKREGILAAANRIIQGCCCGISDRCNWCDDAKIIRSLLSAPACTFCVEGVVNAVEGGTAPCPKCSAPEPEVSQDAAPATASDPTAIKSSAEGREVSMEDATFEAGGDSLVARLRRIVAWFAIPGHRGTPCEEDLADITAAADALESTSVLKVPEPDAPGADLVARLRAHASGGATDSQGRLLAGEAADALEGAKERIAEAVAAERAACAVEAEFVANSLGLGAAVSAMSDDTESLIRRDAGARVAGRVANAIRARAKKGE